jgi:hypothetical protein
MVRYATDADAQLVAVRGRSWLLAQVACWTVVATSPASDEELLARQSALREEARQVLAGLDLTALVGDAGPLLVTGSFVSGLMCWPEVDVMVHVGGGFSPGTAERPR